MIILNHKRAGRIITVAGLLVLFTFTSLFTVYQNSENLNAAHASSSGNNTPISECIKANLACSIAEMQADIACQENDEDSQTCQEARDHADCVCDAIPADCP